MFSRHWDVIFIWPQGLPAMLHKLHFITPGYFIQKLIKIHFSSYHDLFLINRRFFTLL